MFFESLVTIAVAIGVLSSSVSSQRYPNNGYNDDYNTEYDRDRPAHPTPRSYGSAPERNEVNNNAPKPTPVPILRSINRQNEDGSYTFGFEGADGQFKIETKFANGEIRGKYGFVDDSGKVRVVEYGADRYGFQPAGEGITVAPPTLVDETTGKDGLTIDYPDEPQPQHAARPPPPPPPPQRPVYQPPQQPLQHTQAYYPPQERKNPIFTPAQSPILRPSPPQGQFGPQTFGPAPVQETRNHQTRSQTGGLLDQLARDYALPQGGSQPLHDISFGLY